MPLYMKRTVWRFNANYSHLDRWSLLHCWSEEVLVIRVFLDVSLAVRLPKFWKTIVPSFSKVTPSREEICCYTYYTGRFKRWTNFVSLYGLNSKRRLNTHQTVGCGIPSSLLALWVHLRGLRSKLSSIRLTFSSDTRGRPELLPLHRQPLFAQTGDSNDKCSSSLEVECWKEDEPHAVQQSPTQF